MKKVVAIVIGIILVIGVIVTRQHGLSQANTKIYEQAVAMQATVDEIGYKDFKITDYPVAFYDGEQDYVLTWQNDTYHIEKRKAVMDSIVATAYPVDGHYEVLSPTVEKMSSLLGLMSVGSAEYGEKEHISTLWHEAFHCYQLTNYLENIEVICPTGVKESIIAEVVDVNSQAVTLFEQQAELLEAAVKCDELDKVKAYIVKYRELEQLRNQLFSQEVLQLEAYYTRVEGTACYIEACVYEMQLPESFWEHYVEGISEYAGGSGKYYKIGMAQCMILDKLNADWKNTFDFSENMMELIYRELEIQDEV